MSVIEAFSFQTSIKSLIQGLEDYTVDQRGDVGSWIRIACISGLCSLIAAALEWLPNVTFLQQYLPAELQLQCVGKVLKQGVERLDSVRQVAGEHISRLVPKLKGLSNDLAAWKLRGDKKVLSLLPK